MSTFACKCHWCGNDLIRKTQSVVVKLHFCNRTCKGEHQKTARPVTREWLFDHYITKGLDTTQIAHMVKRDPKSVWNWLKDFCIPRRPRGSGCLTNRFRVGGPHAFKGRKHSAETRKRMSDRAKAEGRVPYDPAVGSYMKGRRGADVPSWKGGVTPERQAFYQTPEWKRAERNVKKRDKHTCQRCGKVKKRGDGQPFDIHHIVSFAFAELRAVESNLIYLCEPCHYWTHSKKNTEGLFVKEIPCDTE